jgi:hypothetical protein
MEGLMEEIAFESIMEVPVSFTGIAKLKNGVNYNLINGKIFLRTFGGYRDRKEYYRHDVQFPFGNVGNTFIGYHVESRERMFETMTDEEKEVVIWNFNIW